MPATESPAPTLDLSVCDREPIRTPGSIQPHGVLLAVGYDDFVIRHVSVNSDPVLGVPAELLVSRPLSALIGSAQADRLRDAFDGCVARGEARSDAPVRVMCAVRGQAIAFNVSLVRTRTVLLVELERVQDHDTLSIYTFQGLVRETLSRVRGARTLPDVAQAVAEQMRVITGYDRVWVYRFHRDWHGEIIAESKADGIESWLGLHYPASDIPAQARALFTEYPLRVIVDAAYVPSLMIPLSDAETGAPLDLGGSILRSVSPIHLTYMRNMGVRASLVVSLLKDGKLWGLVSGHHYSGPRLPSYEVRTVCEFLGNAFAIQVALAESLAVSDQAQRVRAVTSGLLSALARDVGPLPSLLEGPVTLMDLADASGAAVVRGETVASAGTTPTADEIRRLAQWLDDRGERDILTNAGSRDVFAATSLGVEFPEAAEYAEVASGLLAYCVDGSRSPHGERIALLWFRQQRRQVIPWGGDPTKPVRPSADSASALEPRGSFARWEQEVVGTAEPWRESEIDAARSLGSIVETLMDRGRRLADSQRRDATLSDFKRELETIARDAAVSTERSGPVADSMARVAARIEALLLNLALEQTASISHTPSELGLQ